MIVTRAEKQSFQMVVIAPLVTFLKHLITATNMWILKKSKGRLGNSFLGVPVLLLYSVGFKSGVERETPLFFEWRQCERSGVGEECAEKPGYPREYQGAGDCRARPSRLG